MKAIKGILLLLLLIVFALGAVPCLAAGFETDEKGPTVANITLSKSENVKPGEVITVTAEITDESGIKEVWLDYLYQGTGWSVKMKKTKGNVYTGKIKVDKKFKTGKWDINISATDRKDNDGGDSIKGAFSVAGGVNDFSGPEISHITFSSKQTGEITVSDPETGEIVFTENDKMKLKPGQTLVVNAVIKDESKLKFVFLNWFSAGTGSGDCVDMKRKNGNTYTGKIKISGGTVTGDYDISIDAIDKHENSSEVFIKKAFTVSGAAGDKEGPVIKNITINKQEGIKPGDVITVTAEITDESKIRQMMVSYTRIGSFKGEAFDMKRVKGDVYSGSFKITSDMKAGRYYVAVFAEDQYGHSSEEKVSPAFVLE